MGIRAFLGLSYYESELDQFLAEYDHKHPKPSAAQRQEIDKYRRIYALRDGQQAAEKTDLWEKF